MHRDSVLADIIVLFSVPLCLFVSFHLVILALFLCIFVVVVHSDFVNVTILSYVAVSCSPAIITEGLEYNGSYHHARINYRSSVATRKNNGV